MTTSMNQIANLSSEYTNFQNSFNTAGAALNNVIVMGTALHNDATLAAIFPTTYVAYQTYLVSLQTAINTFIAGLPVAPPLNG